ncbi:hypothetical protein PITCH_A1900010 [uncultured Desulfobacterium sp.]|uniref:DUF4340 domain-containing protein n=1 Tax=uncultured Desulfobacterium sp. TaxID=201089 RepID=A0A445MVP4_9BACT|nr:hypothetical protein PITCH_A1900010 [uncultured Desulfobacterium sp.]
MSLMRSLVLLIVFIILALYVFFFESGGKDKENSLPPVKKALDIIPEDIGEIVLRRDDLYVLLENIDSKWRIKRPFEADANNDMVHDLLSIFDCGIVRVIDEKPSNLKTFGLTSPRYLFAVKDKKGRVRTLLVGDDAPGNLSCYSKLEGSSQVFLLGVRYRQEFDRALAQFARPQGKR